MTGVTLYNVLPRSIMTFVIRLPCSIMKVILLQHGYCTFVINLFGPCTRLFINLTMCIRALSTQICNHSWTCRTSILEGDSSTGTSSSGTSGSRRLSLTLLHERIRKRIRLCHFCTHNFVTETTSVSFRALPVGFPLPTISQSSLSTLFLSPDS